MTESQLRQLKTTTNLCTCNWTFCTDNKQLTVNVFHDNHDRLSLCCDADEPDNVRVVVLFQYAALL